MAGKKGRASKVLVWIILGLLVVGLTGFGARNFGNTIQSVGRVGKTEIPAERYVRALSQELGALQAQAGRNITLTPAQQLSVGRGVLQRLIASAALENEISRLGLSVGDGEVRRQILIAPAFAGQDGQFSRDAYEFALQQTGQNAAEFENTIRIGSASEILQAAVALGVAAPPTYADVLLAYLGERRNFSWLQIDADSLNTDLPEPTDADVLAFYNANPTLFILPASKRISYVWLSPDLIGGDIEISADEVRAFYDERVAEFTVVGQRLVERLDFATSLEATAARADIRAGTATFDDYVQRAGLSLEDVNIGAVTRESFGIGADAVFAMTEPGVSEPIDSDMGPALVRVYGIVPARSISFEAAREALREELVARRARSVIGDQITELDDLLAGGATLEELASESDMQLAQIDWTPGSGDGVAALPAFIQAAATVSADDFPAIANLDDGGIFAMRLDQLVDERAQPFEDARADVAAAWSADALATKISEQANALVSRLGAGESLDSLSYPVAVETDIIRSDVIDGAPPEFLPAVFGLDVGERTMVQVPGIAMIAVLDAILPPAEDNPLIEQLRGRIEDNTAQGISQDALAAFTFALQNEAGISINQAALDPATLSASGGGGGDHGAGH
ncbi:MAG: SurA N-terminal domain-containing protein [Paracoccaceae bacterium]